MKEKTTIAASTTASLVINNVQISLKHNFEHVIDVKGFMIHCTVIILSFLLQQKSAAKAPDVAYYSSTKFALRGSGQVFTRAIFCLIFFSVVHDRWSGPLRSSSQN